MKEKKNKNRKREDDPDEEDYDDEPVSIVDDEPNEPTGLDLIVLASPMKPVVVKIPNVPSGLPIDNYLLMDDSQLATEGKKRDVGDKRKKLPSDSIADYVGLIPENDEGFSKCLVKYLSDSELEYFSCCMDRSISRSDVVAGVKPMSGLSKSDLLRVYDRILKLCRNYYNNHSRGNTPEKG